MFFFYIRNIIRNQNSNKAESSKRTLQKDYSTPKSFIHYQRPLILGWFIEIHLKSA